MSVVIRTALPLLLLTLVITAPAQSPLPDHPTPLTTNAFTGSIPARDLGDSRLTTHYFWFEGGQGDIFVNLVTKNFSGDIDIFVQAGLRTLAKIVVYPDFGEVETGRVMYLRKPERLLLRVQGRTPNEGQAEYRLKFAGSFIAATASSPEVEIPKVTGETVGAVRVNSVGTILPPPPKPVETQPSPETKTEERETQAKTEVPKPADEAPTITTPTDERKLEVVVTDNVKPEVKAPPVRTTARSRRTSATRNTRPAAPPPAKTESAKPDASATTDEKADAVPDEAKIEPPKTETKSTPADPLGNIQLVIEFKDGRKIERPLTEVLRFSVDKGVLTVISKNGRIGKYSMLDVSKVTIQ